MLIYANDHQLSAHTNISYPPIVLTGDTRSSQFALHSGRKKKKKVTLLMFVMEYAN